MPMQLNFQRTQVDPYAALNDALSSKGGLAKMLMARDAQTVRDQAQAQRQQERVQDKQFKQKQTADEFAFRTALAKASEEAATQRAIDIGDRMNQYKIAAEDRAAENNAKAYQMAAKTMNQVSAPVEKTTTQEVTSPIYQNLNEAQMYHDQSAEAVRQFYDSLSEEDLLKLHPELSPKRQTRPRETKEGSTPRRHGVHHVSNYIDSHPPLTTLDTYEKNGSYSRHGMSDTNDYRDRHNELDGTGPRAQAYQSALSALVPIDQMHRATRHDTVPTTDSVTPTLAEQLRQVRAELSDPAILKDPIRARGLAQVEKTLSAKIVAYNNRTQELHDFTRKEAVKARLNAMVDNNVNSKITAQDISWASNILDLDSNLVGHSPSEEEVKLAKQILKYGINRFKQ